MYVSKGIIPMPTEEMLFISGSVSGAWAYLMVLSTSRNLKLPTVKPLCKAINTQRAVVASTWQV